MCKSFDTFIVRSFIAPRGTQLLADTTYQVEEHYASSSQETSNQTLVFSLLSFFRPFTYFSFCTTTNATLANL